MARRPHLFATGLLFLVAALGLAVPAAADHPVDEAVLVVVDGPRHDLAFDERGPFAPLYEAGNVTFANNTWAAGRAKSVPGHAALLTGRPQPIANDGSEEPRGPLLWDRLAEERGWDADEMRWLYQKPKLGVLATPATGGGLVEGPDPDEAMLAALAANVSDPSARFVAASFAEPDRLGHDGEWEAHRASLARIAEGLAGLVDEHAGEDTLVVVTADHARYCEEPDDHGRLGPLAPVDDCDAHVPLFAAGWHVRVNATVAACLTQADVGVLLAEAMGTSFPNASGRFPRPLVDAGARWQAPACPPARGGGPIAVSAAGPGLAAATLLVVALGLGGRRSSRSG